MFGRTAADVIGKNISTIVRPQSADSVRQSLARVASSDTVAFGMPRAVQTQVNPAANLDFASALRALLRQDPDIIMVGEIRDRETAEIAVRVALVGRLLLSTLHTNDSTSAIPRLFDMGIEPFLLASTLQLVVAQRLVRLQEVFRVAV